MTHDESVYPDPFTFKPERFFGKNGELNEGDKVLAYGFGRRCSPYLTVVNSFSQRHRVCVGKHVASATVSTFSDLLCDKLKQSEQLWLTFASVLATFNIEKARDSRGREIEMNDEYEDLGALQ